MSENRHTIRNLDPDLIIEARIHVLQTGRLDLSRFDVQWHNQKIVAALARNAAIFEVYALLVKAMLRHNV